MSSSGYNKSAFRDTRTGKTDGARAKRVFIVLMVLFLVVTAAAMWRTNSVSEVFEPLAGHTLVLDPGHGGFDGGAVSDDGTKESDLNLSIALRTQAIAEFVGQKTRMTRENDSARTDFASYSEHQDLVRRAALVNETPGAILFSIHQNDYPTGQPSGAQVLYSSYAGSEALGKLVHNNLLSALDPENRRVAEPAPNNLYLTANAECPAILIECGFMSNNFEVLKLCDDAYQTSISTVLIASFLQYLTACDKR